MVRQVLVGYNDLGKPIRKTFYGNIREDVARKVSKVTCQVFCGNLPEAKKKEITLGKLLDDFLWSFKKPTVSDVTFEWYLGISKTHIIPALGHMAAQDVTPYNIQSLLNNLHEQKSLAQRSVKGVRDTLNQAFNFTIELNLMAVNPVSGTKLPKASRIKAEQKEDTKVIPVDQRAQILSATESDLRMKTAVTVLMFTGMRIGEFLALTWGQVDFKNSSIVI